MWSDPAARNVTLLLIRRYAAEGTARGYEACLKLLRAAPAQYADAVVEPLRKGLAERAVGLQAVGQGTLFGAQAAENVDEHAAVVRQFEPLTPALRDFVATIWNHQQADAGKLELALRAGVDESYPALLSAAFKPSIAPAEQIPLLALVREFGKSDVAPTLLEIVIGKNADEAKLAALDALAAFDSPTNRGRLLDLYPTASNAVQHRIRDVMFTRADAAIAFLKALDNGKLEADEVPLEQLRRLSLHHNDQIDTLVRKHWGNIGPGSPEEKLAAMRRFNNDIRAAAGNPAAGKLLFEKHCGTCHQLFGSGNKIGPELTTANRGDTAALLGNIVDPSAVIRREYMSYVVMTTSGRVLTGVMAEQDGASITILDANNQRTKIPRDEIDELREAETSLMPEQILDNLTPQEHRDLFAYLQSNKP
jgi:putative heme-binding domain-containing protein